MVDPSRLGLLNGRRQRTHSNANSPRASSPASSMSSSHSAKDGSEDEIIHERERNWNAPRAKWTSHDHGHKHDHPLRKAGSSAKKNSQSHIQDEGNAHLSNTVTYAEHKAPSPLESDKSNSTKRLRLSHLQDEAKLRALTFSRNLDSPLPHRSFGKGKASEKENGRPTSTNSGASVSTQLHGVSSDRQPTPQKVSYTDSSESDPLPPINTIRDEDQKSTGMRNLRPQFVLLKNFPLISVQPDGRVQYRKSSIQMVPPRRSPSETPRNLPSLLPSPEHEALIHSQDSASKGLNSVGDAEPGVSVDNTGFQSLAPSPPSTPPISSPSRATLPNSNLSTSPRHLSLSSRIDFERPSTPKGFPTLPVLSTSSLQSDQEQELEIPSDSGWHRPDVTAMKTPKPPGAWTSTPGPARVSIGSPETKIEEEQQADEDVGTPLHHSEVDQTSTKTPKPPGAWAATPAPVDRCLPGDESSSMPTTPTESLVVGASALPAQTPKPPGGWMTTPAVRKSIMKVRFETHVDEDKSNDTSKPPGQDVSVEMDVSTFIRPNGDDSQPATADTPTPDHLPASSRTPSRRSSIRILDAFGMEVPQDAKEVARGSITPRSKGSIRVVDAMGRFMDDGGQPENAVSLKHNEALSRVRQGLSELAEGLEDLDK